MEQRHSAPVTTQTSDRWGLGIILPAVFVGLIAGLATYLQASTSHCVEADFFDTPAICTAGHLDVVSEDPLIVRCVCPIEEE